MIVPLSTKRDKIRKITGKGQSNGIKYIVIDGHTITNIKQTSNTLADTLSFNSSSTNYSNVFQNHKFQQEQVQLNFESDHIEDYNLPFTLNELQDSLNKAHDTTVGPDDIHYQIIKHLPDISLHALLDLCNDIWDYGVLPPGWREATIIPIPKPGIYLTKPQSDERLRLPTTCDYLRPAVIVGSRSDFYHNRTSSHTLRSLYDRSSMIVAFWSLSRMKVADCCTAIVRPSYDSRRPSAICHD